jgi:hypothetical protein
MECPKGFHSQTAMIGEYPFVTWGERCVPDEVLVPEIPKRTGKNPHGGGGNQWQEMVINRQGNYGVGRTFLGKIVHKRERHYFAPADLYRIQRNVIKQIGQNLPDTWTWWDFLIDTILHLFGGVSVLSDVTTKPTIQSFMAVFQWFKDNQAWAETWRPRVEKAFEAFWGVINGTKDG